VYNNFITILSQYIFIDILYKGTKNFAPYSRLHALRVLHHYIYFLCALCVKFFPARRALIKPYLSLNDLGLQINHFHFFPKNYGILLWLHDF